MKNEAIVPKSANFVSTNSSNSKNLVDQLETKLKQEQNQCNQTSFLESFVQNEPPYSECARFLKRPLSWAYWIRGLSDRGEESYLGKHNLEFLHEHIFFDQSRDQIGFGPEGLFVEDPTSKGYRTNEECIDGSQLRQALSNLEYDEKYSFIRNNCQDFAATVRKALK